MDIKDPSDLISLVLSCVVIGYFVWSNFIRNKQGLKRLSKATEQLGFAYIQDGLETLPSDLRAHPFMPGLDVFGMTAVWKGSVDGLETFLIWKWKWKNATLGNRYIGMIAACIRANPPYLPEFRLIPEFSVLGDIRDDRAFNDSYWFEPPDDMIRTLLCQSEVMSLFENNKGWYFHNSGRWAIAYRYSEKDVSFELFGEFIKRAFRVFRILDENWKAIAVSS